MSGIIDYFHGERAVVTDKWWQLVDTDLVLRIELANDPHRAWAQDYAGDIGIDPNVTAGDEVVYVRLDDTTGIWLRERDQHGSDLSDAISRVMSNREWMKRWHARSHDPDKAMEVAQAFFAATQEPIRIVIGQPTSERPATQVSFFLSYSSRNTLLARQIYGDLRTDAGVEVWFDLAQSADAGRNRDELISNWLRDSVYACKGFLLLLTKAALDSDWVAREIDFALHKRRSDDDFHLLVLKADDCPVPSSVTSTCRVVDCDGIWWSRGINEELFAAIYGRPGRRAWLEAEPAHSSIAGDVLTYDDLATDAGTVVRFSWSFNETRSPHASGNDVSWSLEYERRPGEVRQVTGHGKEQPVDLDMQSGDRVGFIKVRRRKGSDFRFGLPLWMRSNQLNVTTDSVLDRYYGVLAPKEPAAAAKPPASQRIGPPAADARQLSIRLLEAGLAFLVNYEGSRTKR